MAVIYQITCKANGKSYIGQSTHSFNERYQNGEFWIETHNRELQRDCYEYGKDFMEVTILLDSPFIMQDELSAIESVLIEKRRTFHPNGYNLKRPYRNESATNNKTRLRPLKGPYVRSLINSEENSIKVRLNDNESNVLNYIAKFGPTPSHDINLKVNLSKQGLKVLLGRLKKQGLIQLHGRGPSAVYMLK
ncbi:MAG: hypothetical protein EOP04_04615 [Proteobacteria bacterium]|nr:MAG: hypothetical protein EOP04_04615 [Pseudomonadota bacterium]